MTCFRILLLAALRCAVLPVAVALGGAQVAGAQPLDAAPLRFVRYTTDDGLPHATILSITRDRRGFLWVGTLDGLARFDGHTFEVFRPDPNRPGTLSDGLIHDVQETPDGAIWIATRGGGLNRFDPDTETFRVYQNLPDVYVNGFSVRPDGRLWVYTARGVCLLDPARDACRPVRWEGTDTLTPGTLIDAALLTRSGTWWVATGSALYRATQPDERGDTLTAHVTPVPLPSGVTTIARISELDGGDLWVGTLSQGLLHLDGAGQLIRHYRVGARAPYPFRAAQTGVWFTHDGWIWGRHEPDLILISPQTGAVRAAPFASAPPGSAPTTAYRDANGTVWIGTWGGGLYQLVPTPPFALLRREDDGRGLISSFLLSAAEDGTGRLWVGTSEGLDRLDSLGGPVQSVLRPGRATCQGSIWAIHPGREALWIGTRMGGLCAAPNTALGDAGVRFTPVGTDDLVSHDVRTILQDRRGWLWIGHTDGGLQVVEQPERWRRGESVPVHTIAGFDGLGINILYEAPSGDVWVGTRTHGAFRLRVRPANTAPDVQAMPVPVGPEGTPHPDVRGFWEAPDSTVWTATYGGGIGAWHPQRGARHIGRAEGLPNTFTYAVLPDGQGHLWVPTNSGLARYSLVSGQVRTFTAADGLQDDEFNTGAWHAGRSGRLYAGGVGGLSVWRPEDVDPPGLVPPVYLTGLSIFGEVRDFGRRLDLLPSLTLPYDENFLTFAYTTPALTDAENIRYRYWLEGVDPVPVEAGTRRFAGYTGLAPGHYRFVVEAYHADAPEAVQRATLALTITPPWWRTPWFYALMAFVLLGGLVAAVRWISTRKLRARVRALETERRLHAERARISRDLHDHVGAQLTSLVSGLELAEAYAQHGRGAERDRTVHALQGEARHAIAQLRGTIWALSDEPVSLRRFADQAARYAQEQARFCPGLRLHVEKQVADDHPLAPTQALHLYRIVQEAVQNTIKHAGAHHLTLRIVGDRDHLRLDVQDDGQFSHDAPGSGLSNMAHRAKEIGATFTLSTDGGTTVHIHLPLNEPVT